MGIVKRSALTFEQRRTLAIEKDDAERSKRAELLKERELLLTSEERIERKSKLALWLGLTWGLGRYGR
jgi:hypothetical protein